MFYSALLRPSELVDCSRFGSVDMVSVGGELMVLEINIGVQMDNIIAQGNGELARAV